MLFGATGAVSRGPNRSAFPVPPAVSERASAFLGVDRSRRKSKSSTSWYQSVKYRSHRFIVRPPFASTFRRDIAPFVACGGKLRERHESSNRGEDGRALQKTLEAGRGPGRKPRTTQMDAEGRRRGLGASPELRVDDVRYDARDEAGRGSIFTDPPSPRLPPSLKELWRTRRRASQ